MPLKRRLSGLAGAAALAACAMLWNAPAAWPQASTIESTVLTPLSAWEVGALEPGALALPNTLWVGSDGATLAGVFAGLPNTFASPAARRLALGALLSPAMPSDAGTFKALLERYEAIGRLGAAQALADMVRLSGQARAEPNLAVFAAQAELALQHPSEACRRAREVAPSLPALLKLRAFCLAIAGDAAGAGVAIDVARSTGAADKFLYAALPLLAGGAGAGPPARYDSALNSAVSVTAKLRAPAKPLADASNLALINVATSPQAMASLRAEALVTALARGMLDPAAARAAALETLKAWPAGRGAPVMPPWLRALRDVDAAAAPLRPAKVADYLARAPNAAERLALGRLFLPEITAPPLAGPAPASGLRLARSALILGETQAAQRWRAVLGSETSPAALATLDAALAVASGGDSVAAARQRLAASVTDVARGQRDVALLSTLAPLPQDLQALLASTSGSGAPLSANPSLLALLAAADRGAVGETALRTAILLTEAGTATDSATFASLVGALQKVGLASAARAIVTEAILG